MPSGLASAGRALLVQASGPARTSSVTVHVLSRRTGFLLVQTKVIAAGQGLEVGIGGLIIQSPSTPPSCTYAGGPTSAGVTYPDGLQ